MAKQIRHEDLSVVRLHRLSQMNAVENAMPWDELRIPWAKFTVVSEWRWMVLNELHL